MTPDQKKAIAAVKRADKALAKAGMSVIVTDMILLFFEPYPPNTIYGMLQTDKEYVRVNTKAVWAGRQG